MRQDEGIGEDELRSSRRIECLVEVPRQSRHVHMHAEATWKDSIICNAALYNKQDVPFFPTIAYCCRMMKDSRHHPCSSPNTPTRRIGRLDEA